MQRAGGLVLAGALAAVLAGCTREASPPAASPQTAAAGDVCVDIPEGYYHYDTGPDQFTPVTFVEGQTYRVVDGALILVREPARPAGPDTAAMAGRIAAGFPALGFPWLGLDLRGSVATLTGTAPDAASKQDALTRGEAAIRADAEAGRFVTLIVDGISVQGGERAVGEALLGLGASPTLAECQAAFVSTMEGRNIEFEVNKANINPVSARLLDALSGVATLCTASGDMSVEIGGHTDKRGSDASNLALSQSRAERVRDYLISKGVPANVLVATGYGETDPLDPADTLAAYARNRRTEFTLQPR